MIIPTKAHLLNLGTLVITLLIESNGLDLVYPGHQTPKVAEMFGVGRHSVGSVLN